MTLGKAKMTMNSHKTIREIYLGRQQMEWKSTTWIYGSAWIGLDTCGDIIITPWMGNKWRNESSKLMKMKQTENFGLKIWWEKKWRRQQTTSKEKKIHLTWHPPPPSKCVFLSLIRMWERDRRMRDWGSHNAFIIHHNNHHHHNHHHQHQNRSWKKEIPLLSYQTKTTPTKTPTPASWWRNRRCSHGI